MPTETTLGKVLVSTTTRSPAKRSKVPSETTRSAIDGVEVCLPNTVSTYARPAMS